MNNLILSNPLKSCSIAAWYPVASAFSNTFMAQGVRFRKRKPMELGRAPSKFEIVTHRKRNEPDHTKELIRIYNNYKCFTKMVVNHFAQENDIQRASGQMSETFLQKEELEHQSLLELNQIENERIAQKRKDRREKEEEELLKLAIERIEEHNLKEQEELGKAKQKFEAVKNLVPKLLKKQNLREEIERCLMTPKDYHFSIDLQGRVYEGRHTLPHLVDAKNMPLLTSIEEEEPTNEALEN